MTDETDETEAKYPLRDPGVEAFEAYLRALPPSHDFNDFTSHGWCSNCPLGRFVNQPAGDHRYVVAGRVLFEESSIIARLPPWCELFMRRFDSSLNHTAQSALDVLEGLKNDAQETV